MRNPAVSQDEAAGFCVIVPDTSFAGPEFALPYPMRRTVSEQVMVQLIEADVDIGFGLVDQAKAYRLQGNTQFSSRALEEANAVVADIERRLERLGQDEGAPFRALVEELRTEIASMGP